MDNTTQYCRRDLFKNSEFTDDLEDSKSISEDGDILCIFGSRTLKSISWMSKEKTSVSCSSAESEIISLNTRLRKDGKYANDFLDVELEVYVQKTTLLDKVN